MSSAPIRSCSLHPGPRDSLQRSQALSRAVLWQNLRHNSLKVEMFIWAHSFRERLVHHSGEGMVPGAHGGICGNLSRHRRFFTLTGSGSREGRLGPGTYRTNEGLPSEFLLKAPRPPLRSQAFKTLAHSRHLKRATA